MEEPAPTATMMKNTGKDRDSAARASVEMRPLNQVSVILYRVLNKNPMLTGTDNLRTCAPTGPTVKSRLMAIPLCGGLKVFSCPTMNEKARPGPGR